MLGCWAVAPLIIGESIAKSFMSDGLPAEAVVEMLTRLIFGSLLSAPRNGPEMFVPVVPATLKVPSSLSFASYTAMLAV